jgi:PBSX family phage terminase large subunit
MNLHQAQSQIASDTHRFRVVNCGRRFGKTTLAVLEMVAKAVYGNDRMIAYIAPTYQQSRDIAWQELKKICLPIANKINESRLEIIVNTVHGGTSTIMLRGWESIETLRGQKFHFIVVDEIASMRNWATNWQEVIRPTLTDFKGEALFISTPKGFNHFYDLYNQEHKDSDYKSFHFTTYDNTHIPFEEIEKAKKELTEDRFAQEYMADFRKTEGLVYKEFDRTRHLYTDTIFNPVDVLVPIDWGWTNPACILKVIKDTDRKYYISQEWYKTNKTTLEIIEVARSFGGNKYYPDPAEPDRIDEARKAGLNIRDVSKDIEAGIICVQELFKQNRLFIHTSCTNLISELETYSYPEKKPDKNESELPIKENDHACFTKDAILSFPIGSILKSQSSGIRDVYEFIGSKVTADHPYLTQRGFVRLDALRYSDRIVIWKNKSMMELSLDDTQTQNAVSLGTILYLLQRNKQAIKQNVFIGMYGKNIMARYLRATMFIIKTVLQLTTTYLISKLYHLENIITSITSKTWKVGGRISKWLGNLQTSGTARQKDYFFTHGWVSNLGKIKRNAKETVTSVVKNIKHHFQHVQSSATIIAKLKHLGKEEVFSTVTTNGFFLANGVVVSNCDAMRYALYMNEGKGITGKAHVHYSQSAQPTHNSSPSINNVAKIAHTYIPRL